MKKGLDIKFMVIIVLAVIIVGMGIAFAALTQSINITGIAGIGDASWKVEITKFVEDEVVGATTNGFGKSATSATFDVSLDYPGAYVVYQLTVKNKGTIDAKLESITGVAEANLAEPNVIKFTVTGVNVDQKLAKDEEKVVEVKVEWLPEVGGGIPQVDKSKTASITLNYVQDTN